MWTLNMSKEQLAIGSQEKFAQQVSKGVDPQIAALRAGYISENATNLLESKEVKERVAALSVINKDSIRRDIEEYVAREGITPSKLLNEVYVTALAAREKGKFTDALVGLKMVGQEVFDMWSEKKTSNYSNDIPTTINGEASSDSVQSAFQIFNDLVSLPGIDDADTN